MQAIKAAAVEGDTAKLESFRATYDPRRAMAYSTAHAALASPADARGDNLAEGVAAMNLAENEGRGA